MGKSLANQVLCVFTSDNITVCRKLSVLSVVLTLENRWSGIDSLLSRKGTPRFKKEEEKIVV